MNVNSNLSTKKHGFPEKRGRAEESSTSEGGNAQSLRRHSHRKISVESALWTEDGEEGEDPLLGVCCLCPNCGEGNLYVFIDTVAKQYRPVYFDGEQSYRAVLAHTISRMAIHELTHWVAGADERIASSAEELVDDYLLMGPLARIYNWTPQRRGDSN